MTTNYTKIPKATSTTYVALSGGMTLFNDANVSFDSSSIPFDGINLQYTKINKGSGTSYTKIPKGT